MYYVLNLYMVGTVEVDYGASPGEPDNTIYMYISDQLDK